MGWFNTEPRAPLPAPHTHSWVILAADNGWERKNDNGKTIPATKVVLQCTGEGACGELREQSLAGSWTLEQLKKNPKKEIMQEMKQS